MIDLGVLFGGETDDDPPSPEYEAALAWHGKGFNVVPLNPRTKHPCVKYAEWHHRRQTRAEVAMMRPQFDGGVAVLTGAVSVVVCIDCDGPAGERIIREYEASQGPLPQTLTIRSGSGRGVHRYFKHPRDGRRIKTVSHNAIKLDVRGDGGIAVIPPTLHKSGGRYQIERDAEPAELPEGLLEFIEAKAVEANGQSANGRAGSQTPQVRAAALGNNLDDRVPVNRTNVAIVQSMLNALPDRYADEFDLWLRAGFALHNFDDGEVGLALWKRFSKRCPEKADMTDFARRWAGFSRDHEGKKISLGWLRAQAQAHGWRAPCRWDRSTKIAS
jgi:hypothetical protein